MNGLTDGEVERMLKESYEHAREDFEPLDNGGMQIPSLLSATALAVDQLRAGWVLVLLGLASGLFLGLGFHLDHFLGGYTSLRRRLVRLGHIALVALGALNVLWALSA
jgi:hypothetical protein